MDSDLTELQSLLDGRAIPQVLPSYAIMLWFTLDVCLTESKWTKSALILCLTQPFYKEKVCWVLSSFFIMQIQH